LCHYDRLCSGGVLSFGFELSAFLFEQNGNLAIQFCHLSIAVESDSLKFKKETVMSINNQSGNPPKIKSTHSEKQLKLFENLACSAVSFGSYIADIDGDPTKQNLIDANFCVIIFDLKRDHEKQCEAYEYQLAELRKAVPKENHNNDIDSAVEVIRGLLPERINSIPALGGVSEATISSEVDSIICGIDDSLTTHSMAVDQVNAFRKVLANLEPISKEDWEV